MAKQGKRALKGAKERARAIKAGVEDLMLPEAVTPDGQRIKIRPQREHSDNAVFSQAQNLEGSGIPHSERSTERSSHRESTEDILKQGSVGREIRDALEVLDLPLLEVLQKHQVNVRVIEKMEDVYPNDPARKKFMGAYDWGRNTIFVPEKVWRGGEYVDNFDVDFAIRHEVGHAFNAKSLEEPGRYYSQSRRLSDRLEGFVGAFEKDLLGVPESVLTELGFDPTTKDGLSFMRDEIFADAFAHATEFPTKNRWSQLIKQHFGSTIQFMKENACVQVR